MALFQLGFRPFFLAAGALAVAGMALWMGVWVFHLPLLPESVSPPYWHAHEMIYGYALAVVAGFLLTAVRNWTGVQTLCGRPLQLLLAIWLLARCVVFLDGRVALMAALLLDDLFIIYLSVALTLPVARARLWKNMGVISKLYFFLVGNIIYTLGALGLWESGERIGVFIGLYMILSLILVLARRVLPMFIERGVGGGVTLTNRTWVDIACFLLFLIFAVLDIFFAQPALVAGLSAALAVLHSIRLAGWHTAGIWRRPLLWVLFIAYGWMIVGFALIAAASLFDLPPSLAIHALTVGGIGMMTLGMMCRIAWGHTGRDIQRPPHGLTAIFLLLAIAAVTRVFLPLWFDPQLAIACSQLLWIAAFTLFLYRYSALLIRPRIDGKAG